MIEPWMHADPLLDRLIRYGDDSASAFAKVERIAMMTADGIPEIDAIQAVIGYVPTAERERIAMQCTDTTIKRGSP